MEIEIPDKIILKYKLKNVNDLISISKSVKYLVAVNMPYRLEEKKNYLCYSCTWQNSKKYKFYILKFRHTWNTIYFKTY